MKAIILAAGYGQRFQPHTLQLAKPALPLFDVPMIAHPIHYLNLMGTKELIVNTHHLPQTVRRAVNQLNLSQSISWSFEPQILNSGGGIKNIENFFRGENHFVVANADCVLSVPHGDVFSRFVDQHEKSNALATLFSCPHKGSQYGALWCDKNRVKSIGQISPYSHLKAQHYIGLMIFSKEIFAYLPDGPSNIFLDSVNPAIEKGELVQSFYVEDVNWFETGYLSSYLNAQRSLLIQMDKSHPHSSFVKSTYRYFLDYDMEVDRQLQWISPHAIVDGTSKIGSNVVICSGAEIGQNIHLDNSVISWDGLLNKTVCSEMIL